MGGHSKARSSSRCQDQLGGGGGTEEDPSSSAFRVASSSSSGYNTYLTPSSRHTDSSRKTHRAALGIRWGPPQTMMTAGACERRNLHGPLMLSQLGRSVAMYQIFCTEFQLITKTRFSGQQRRRDTSNIHGSSTPM